jgi:transposase
VDRGKAGSAVHLATEGRGLPLAAVVSGANAAEGQQVAAVFEALVVAPPEPLVAQTEPDPRDLPSSRGDGAYGNAPTRESASASGFRMRAPKRGQTRLPGIGRIRSAVERGHALLSQFGRVARRFDRLAAYYLAWVQIAACIIFIRAGFVA